MFICSTLTLKTVLKNLSKYLNYFVEGHWPLYDLIFLRINCSLIIKRYITLTVLYQYVCYVFVGNMRKFPQNNIQSLISFNGIGSIW